MNVLSLFDGISCGQLALQRAGIDVDNYFASEIDEKVIGVTKKHFPNTIFLGDVKEIDISGLPKIDLLIGGSPCQGFSFAGKRLIFEDKRSALFFEFVRILKEIKPKYFLLENVRMKEEYLDIISEYLGVRYLKINSALVSAQKRIRFYWTNIELKEKLQDSNKFFNKYLYRLPHGYVDYNIKFHEKYPSLCSTTPGAKYRIIDDIEDVMCLTKKDLRYKTRFLTPEEAEDLQTLPIGYTKTLNKNDRYKAIGNGWTVDIIAYFLKNIGVK